MPCVLVCVSLPDLRRPFGRSPAAEKKEQAPVHHRRTSSKRHSLPRQPDASERWSFWLLRTQRSLLVSSSSPLSSPPASPLRASLQGMCHPVPLPTTCSVSPRHLVSAQLYNILSSFRAHARPPAWLLASALGLLPIPTYGAPSPPPPPSCGHPLETCTSATLCAGQQPPPPPPPPLPLFPVTAQASCAASWPST
ncbi:ATPase alpha subunit, partial [Leishmania donovani]